MKIQLKTPKSIENFSGLLLVADFEAMKRPEGLPKPALEAFEAFRKGLRGDKIKAPRTLQLPGSGKNSGFFLRLSTPNFHKDYPEVERIKLLGARAAEAAIEQDLRSVGFCLPRAEEGRRCAQALVEGAMLGAYRFEACRGKDYKPRRKPDLVFFAPSTAQNALRKATREAAQLAEAVNATRELCNRPGRDLPPEALATEARRLARETGLSCSVLNETQLERQGYRGLLTVGGGSAHPPRMIILRHRPKGAPKTPHLCLVGKGVTFDTGGVSLKRSKDMWEMKMDMSGAAAALGAIGAIARAGVKRNVTAVLVAAENTLSEKAVLPGDVFMARNGKTVHVINTDAEGRLILSDGLYRAGEEKATHVVDIATLTGAMMMALGKQFAGVMGNDQPLVDAVLAAGARSGENIWQMPLPDEYKSMLKSTVADLDNIGPAPYGGAITAGLFLQEFVPEGLKWAHLDIAGPAILDKPYKYFSAGSSGSMVRTLLRLAESL